jgi:hypothetical protein
MRLRELPATYLAFAVLTVLGPLGIMLSQGQAVRPSAGGLAILALLLWGLARHARIAWALLLGWDAFMLLAAGATLGGTGMLLSAPLLFTVMLVCVGLLLSPSMLRHVGICQRSAPTARPTA